jgi:hypothetical protein
MESNGATPDAMAQLNAHISTQQHTSARIADELREVLRAEEQVFAELTEQVQESRQRRDHLKRALEHLTGETGKYKTATKPTGKPNTWTVSEETVQKVWDAIKVKTEPFTKTQISKEVHVSSDTINKAVNVLRERELLRITGKVRGGGKSYLPMPDAVEQQQETVGNAA